MIARAAELITLIRDVSCDCKWKFDVTTCNSHQKRNNETCQCECKNYLKCKNDYN